MSHTTNPAPPKVPPNQSPMSQLSADAACFIPSSFEQDVVTSTHDVPPYFNEYLWLGRDSPESNAYLRSLEHWALRQSYSAQHGVQTPFQYHLYPSTEINYYPVTLENDECQSRISPIHNSADGFYPRPTGFSPNHSQMKQTGINVTAGSENKYLESIAHLSVPTTNVLNDSTQVLAGTVIPSHSKRRKKKNKSLIKVETDDQGNQLVSISANHSINAEKSKTVKENGNRITNNQQKGTTKYRDNDSQTDFAEELSRMTLSEKPNLLYRQHDEEIIQNCGTSGSAVSSELQTDNIPGKPMLWAAIVKQNADKKIGEDTSNVNRSLPVNSSFSNRQNTAFGNNRASLKHETKSAFDHSSIRSQSGRRRSTGISTSDYTRGQSSSRKTVHENSSEKGKGQPLMAKDKGQSSSLNKKASNGKNSQIASGTVQKVSWNKPDKRQKSNDQVNFERHNMTFTLNPDRDDSRRGDMSKSPSRRSQTVGSNKNKIPVEMGKSRSISNKQRARDDSTSSTDMRAGKNEKNEVHSDKRHSAKPQTMGKYQAEEMNNPENLESGNSKTKRRRHRKKKADAKVADGNQTTDDVAQAADSLDTDSPKPVEINTLLQFDDEFPALLSAAQDSLADTFAPVKYSDILSGRAKPFNISKAVNQPLKAQKERTREKDANDDADDSSDLEYGNSQLKVSSGKTVTTSAKVNARSVSQPPKSKVKEKKAVGAGKKTKEPITLNIFDMITVKSKNKKEEDKLTKNKLKKDSKHGNVLDATAVKTRRGKEREVPKAKKPSFLRKVILKERESRRQRFLRECTANGEEMEASPEPQFKLFDPSVRRHTSAPTPTSAYRVASSSPAGQRDPFTPSGDTVPHITDSEKKLLQSLIHSRRFREYCTQVLSKEIDGCCVALLQELVRFQDRLYHKDPTKAKLKRRIVLGLREVTKHLKIRKIKCVIISPNLERIQSKGGLDEALYNIIGMCQDQNVPFIFALNHKQLGRACCKVVPVSVVGIFNYEGAEEHFRKLKELTEKARESYREMVSNMKEELDELNQTDIPNENNYPPEISANINASADYQDFPFAIISPIVGEDILVAEDGSFRFESAHDMESDGLAVSLNDGNLFSMGANLYPVESRTVAVAGIANTSQDEADNNNDDSVSISALEFDILSQLGSS